MTTVGLAEGVAVEQDCGEFPHVLDGVVLIGAAARLAAMLDRGFLDEAGGGIPGRGCCRCRRSIDCWAGRCAGSRDARTRSVPVSRCVIGASRA